MAACSSLGKRVAVGFGLVGDRVDLRCGGQTLLGEEISPGLTGVGVIGLLVERRVGVQNIAHKIAVLLLHGAVGVFIEVVDHSRGKVVAADGRGGGVRGKEAAGQHIEEDNDTDDQNGCRRPISVVCRPLLMPFFALLAVSGTAACSLRLFFSRDALIWDHSSHKSGFLPEKSGKSSPQAIQCVLYRKDAPYASIILRNMQKKKSALPEQSAFGQKRIPAEAVRIQL